MEIAQPIATYKLFSLPLLLLPLARLLLLCLSVLHMHLLLQLRRVVPLLLHALLPLIVRCAIQHTASACHLGPFKCWQMGTLYRTVPTTGGIACLLTVSSLLKERLDCMSRR